MLVINFALRKRPSTSVGGLCSALSVLSVNWISSSSFVGVNERMKDDEKKVFWRECATLMMARPKSNGNGSKVEFLLTKRADHAKFMAGSWCFPGGVFSPVDSSEKWLELFSTYGQLHRVTQFRCLDEHARKPELYSSPENVGALPKKVAFRLTAIRETFEECGILLCAPAPGGVPTEKVDDHFSPSTIELPENEVLKWQARVKSNPHEFFTLCEDLNVLPCFDSLYEWSNWLTPTTFQPGRSGTPRRFDAIFYMTILPATEQPKVHIDPGEVGAYKWCSAAELLLENTGHFSALLPPQLSEMGAIRNVTNSNELKELISVRQRLGIRRWYTLQFLASDGVLGCMTGDDLLPEDADIQQFAEIGRLDKTLKQLEESSTNLHRWQFAQDGTYKSLVNTSELKQLYPPGASMTVAHAHSKDYNETDWLRIFANYTGRNQ